MVEVCFSGGNLRELTTRGDLRFFFARFMPVTTDYGVGITTDEQAPKYTRGESLSGAAAAAVKRGHIAWRTVTQRANKFMYPSSTAGTSVVLRGRHITYHTTVKSKPMSALVQQHATQHTSQPLKKQFGHQQSSLLHNTRCLIYTCLFCIWRTLPLSLPLNLSLPVCLHWALFCMNAPRSLLSAAVSAEAASAGTAEAKRNAGHMQSNAALTHTSEVACRFVMTADTLAFAARPGMQPSCPAFHVTTISQLPPNWVLLGPLALSVRRPPSMQSPSGGVPPC